MSYERNKIIGLLYRIFQAEEWAWQDEIPSYEEIDKFVNDLEIDAYKAKGCAECGRIKVDYDKESQRYGYYLDLGTD